MLFETNLIISWSSLVQFPCCDSNTTQSYIDTVGPLFFPGFFGFLHRKLHLDHGSVKLAPFRLAAESGWCCQAASAWWRIDNKMTKIKRVAMQMRNCGAVNFHNNSEVRTKWRKFIFRLQNIVSQSSTYMKIHKISNLGTPSSDFILPLWSCLQKCLAQLHSFQRAQVQPQKMSTASTTLAQNGAGKHLQFMSCMVI